MDRQGGSPDAASPAPEEFIIIGIHGVGSPPVGSVLKDIVAGCQGAFPEEEFWEKSKPPQCVRDGHVYQGALLQSKGRTLHIWEVNWGDLKGFPDTRRGIVLYAMKMVMAMIQISHTGWTTSPGPTGPLWFGCLFRWYFCTFTLVAPICLLLLAFASMTVMPLPAIAIILSILLISSVVIKLLTKVDWLLWFSLAPLGLSGMGALWMIGHPLSDDFVGLLIKVIGRIEGGLGTILFLALFELLYRSLFSRGKSDPTVFAARAGMLVLGATFGAGAYAAIVNAIGFFALERLINSGVVTEGALAHFNSLYLAKIDYDVAQMELINGGTTFLVGLFLVAAVSYQLVRTSYAPENAKAERGLWLRNSVDIFLWLVLAGFLFVFVSTLIDSYGKWASNGDEHRYELGAIVGIQWLLKWFAPSANLTEPVDPLHIYVWSATRIVPFLLPILIPPLRVGLNAAADVLLYILPCQFPLSLNDHAQRRFNLLLAHVTGDPLLKDVRLHIFAHSQGTVVVRDVLLQQSRQERITFLTAGSPLGSLYRRFLGIEVAEIKGVEWKNVYRPSDYIGGELRTPNVCDKKWPHDYREAHFKYFEDGRLIGMLLGKQSKDSAVAASSQRTP